MRTSRMIKIYITFGIIIASLSPDAMASDVSSSEHFGSCIAISKFLRILNNQMIAALTPKEGLLQDGNITADVYRLTDRSLKLQEFSKNLEDIFEKWLTANASSPDVNTLRNAKKNSYESKFRELRDAQWKLSSTVEGATDAVNQVLAEEKECRDWRSKLID